MATWFLGSEAGNGIADLLFGDYSPSGRLPLSFPQKSGQEPFYYNHRTTGRPQLSPDDAAYKARYRDVTTEPLYPFGHGIGYSAVAYSDPTVSSATLPWKGKITVTATVTNSGARPVHEVAQIYVRDRVATITQPIQSLKGIMHLDLAPSETRTVSFDLTRADLAFIQETLKFEAEPGDFDVWIAPSSGVGNSARFTLVV
jgi:beta-glucosidase